MAADMTDYRNHLPMEVPGSRRRDTARLLLSPVGLRERAACVVAVDERRAVAQRTIVALIDIWRTIRHREATRSSDSGHPFVILKVMPCGEQADFSRALSLRLLMMATGADETLVGVFDCKVCDRAA